uniref:Latrophilin-3-like n=1 Tax=Saccoglossus kowalevskii TaxID=10224 RepID=A0ABM0N0V1_SACKO|nr:PREDICTED: latrophilin-3-like [Saccoglossus kowalevskii]
MGLVKIMCSSLPQLHHFNFAWEHRFLATTKPEDSCRPAGRLTKIHSHFVLANRLFMIFDGPDVTSPLILQYCYDYEDIDIVSSSNSITVVFQSDNSMGFRGFYIDYTGVCSGMNISANTSGIIESPNYPNPYPLNVSCDWLLETTYGNKIDIRVLWLDFPISPNCQTDFLSAKDGYSGTSDVIAQLCGNQSDSFSSTDKWMRLGFNSDDVIDNKNYTGFLLEYSNSEITPCEYEPCENNATCTNLFMDYICTCRPGFTGRQCESNIDECDPLPCYNNVTCVDGVNMYTCLCPSGFEGINCEIDIPECLLEPDQPPCHNGGTCLDEINKYSCICTEEFKGPRCKTPANIPMCEAGYDIIEGSGIFWNRTDGDTIDEQPCPPGILGRATRLCVLVNWEPPVAEWDNPQLTYCVSPEFGMLKEKVNNLIESNATAADVLDVTETLRNITFVDVDDGHKKQLYPGDLLISVNTLDVIAYVAMDTENIDTISVSEAFGDSVSNCIDPSVYSVWKNANDEDIVASGATSMVASTELLARGIAQNQTQLMKRRRRRNTEETIQEKIEITSSNLVFVVVVMETPGSLEKWDPSNEIVSRGSLNDSSEIIIPLPASSLQLIMKRDGFVSIFAAKFATIGELYSLYNDTMNDTEDLPVDSRGIQKLNYVNSDVVSGAVLGEDSGSTSLVDPVIIIFEHKEVTGTKNPRCVFMNMNASTLSEQWSSEGCVIQSTNLTHTVCNCYHLTNFALIMDIHNLKEAIPPVHDDILSIISYIGGTLSVLGCVFSVCIYEYFRIWNDRIRVHENLAIAIMTTQLIFLVGIDRTEHFYVCKTVAALLHYFLTALFMWMLIEGINLYVALVKVFGRGSNIKKYLALGWGSPLIVVGVSFGIFYRDYGFGDTCWLPTEIVLIAFAPTVALVIFFNFFILVVVIRVMLNTVTAKEKRQQDELAPIK